MEGLKGRFPPRPPYSVLAASQFTEAYSQARNQRLQELASQPPPESPGLAKNSRRPRHRQCRHTVCAVFHPADRIVWVARGKTPR